MSLSAGFPWSYKNYRFLGYSMAGISTSIAFPDADACFDVAQGLPYQMNVNNLLITHGHMDHAHGLSYVIAQKAMTGQLPPNVYMPPSLVAPMKEIMKLWEKIEDHTYDYNFIGVEEGKEYPLKPPFFARIVPTFHRVDSNGYTIFERKKKLREDFKSLSREELIEKRRKGIELDAYIDDPIATFSGDTRIEILDDPQVQKSKILFLEVTFWDKKKSVENARFWGHIHLDELLPRLDLLKCEKIVLIHASARYTTKYLKEIIEERVPEQHKSRLEIFPRPI